MKQSEKTQVLILGGGFAGLNAALEFEKYLRDHDDIEAWVINRDNYFLFTPMLHEVAASDLDLTNIVIPGRKLLQRVKYVTADIHEIDTQLKSIVVCHGYDDHCHQLRYDHLVLALGSVTNFFELPGLAERALTLKTLGDAMKLRNQLIQHLEEANSDCAAGAREPLLTFVVAGGGFAGVETAAAINDFLRDSTRFHPNIKEDMLRMILVHQGDHLLPELGQKLGDYAETQLKRRGVEVRKNTRVVGVQNEKITLSDQTEVKSHTLVWTAGNSANPVIAAMACNKYHGRIITDEFLCVVEIPGVWAVGDCAAAPDGITGTLCPATAQHASRQGRVVAHNIIAASKGDVKTKFKFRTMGLLASLGKRSAVAEMFGLQFSGFFAWWLWRTLYLSKLPKLEKKIRVAFDWTVDLFFARDFVQYSRSRAPYMSSKEGGEMFLIEC